jgi:uncharacterized protein
VSIVMATFGSARSAPGRAGPLYIRGTRPPSAYQPSSNRVSGHSLLGSSSAVNLRQDEASVQLDRTGTWYIMVIYMMSWTECTGFDWDDGNSGKNWEKHGVADFEAEEMFFNRPFIVRHDAALSREENRWRALGRTDTDRYLFVAFTVRHGLIRVISARLMTRRERRFYAKYEKSEEI